MKTTTGSMLFTEDSQRPRGVQYGHHDASGNSSDGDDVDEAAARKQFLVLHGDELRRRRKEALDSAKSRLAEVRRSNGGVPITRDELSAWVSHNILEIRQRMKEAPVRRRALNHRVKPREGQPPRPHRFQPAEQRHAEANNRNWVKLLDGRVGWHGLVTTTGARMFWLQNHRGQMYIVDLEAWRVNKGYEISKDFNLKEHLRPISSLANSVLDIHVRAIFALKVDGSASGTAAIVLTPTKKMPVTEPLPKRQRRDPDVGSDSAEDIDEHADSDLQSSDCAVDTGSEQGSADASDDGDDELSEDEANNDAPLPVTPAFMADLTKPASSGSAEEKLPRPLGGTRCKGMGRLYENAYFTIAYRMDYPALTCTAFRHWGGAAPKGLGRLLPMSRTVSPGLVLEELFSPTRTMICLRAWMLWRVRKVGFDTYNEKRNSLFVEETARLARDIARLPIPSDGCLGNARANTMLKTWAPDVMKLAKI